MSWIALAARVLVISVGWTRLTISSCLVTCRLQPVHVSMLYVGAHTTADGLRYTRWSLGARRRGPVHVPLQAPPNESVLSPANPWRTPLSRDGQTRLSTPKKCPPSKKFSTSYGNPTYPLQCIHCTVRPTKARLCRCRASALRSMRPRPYRSGSPRL